MARSPHPCGGLSRRRFLLGAGAGLAAGVPLTWLAARPLAGLRGSPALQAPYTSPTAAQRDAMPGPYPGRVIEVHDPASVSDANDIRPAAVAQMMDTGMCALTGADHPQEAWSRFFKKGKVVGIKVNPVGRKRKPRDVGSISSPAVIVEVVRGLKSAGIRAQDIILFERYADEFRDAGYEKLLTERDLAGVRWYAAAARYDDSQLDIDGYPADHRSGCDAHVVGYDPDVFVHMGFAAPEHSPRDDRRFRSHLSLVVSQMVDKFITIPVLKDHRSAGVTLALKNLSHGLNNNVARSHIVVPRGEGLAGPNQCNTFIPTAVGQPLTRQKATLHILDGLIGVYEGGPGSWNQTWATWRHKSLFFATDPVALDRVGWDIIDAQRARQGWPPVARMGLLQYTPGQTAALSLAPLAGQRLADTLTLSASAANLADGRKSEVFELRQPEHVYLAGTVGLGCFDAGQIEHRRMSVRKT